MSTETYIGFFTVSFLVCLSPGPSMLFIIHQGLSRDWRNVFAGIFGLITANLIWTTLCAFGVGTLLQNSHHAFQVLKYLGATYLIYLGINALLRKNKASLSADGEKNIRSILGVFTKGFLTSMSNPKALLFYVAFLPQFLSGTHSYGYEIMFLGILNLTVIFLVMLFYGTISKRIANRVNTSGFQLVMNKVLGLSFIIFGVSLFRFRQTS